MLWEEAKRKGFAGALVHEILGDMKPRGNNQNRVNIPEPIQPLQSTLFN
jgi:hypothetical protein